MSVEDSGISRGGLDERRKCAEREAAACRVSWRRVMRR
jgi:hypothetical protein